MQTMTRESWTDERLDEFGKRIDERFDRVDERIDDLDIQVKQGFEQVDKRFEQVDKRFEEMGTRQDRSEDRMERMQRDLSAQIEGMRDAMDLRFDSVQRNIVYAIVAVGGMLVTTLVAVIGALVMHL